MVEHLTVDHHQRLNVRGLLGQGFVVNFGDPLPVGAIVVGADGKEISRGFSRETDSLGHAEEVAIERAQGDGRLHGATLYSSLEPCGERKSKPTTCAELIISSGIQRVVYAELEPSTFVAVPAGRQILSDGGIATIHLPVRGLENPL